MVKRTLVALVSMMIVMASHAEDSPDTKVPKETQSSIKALGCESCHGWTRTKFGPSWQDVADRYRGKSSYIYKGFKSDSPGEKLALVPGLVKKVSKGGKGEWSEYAPMAHIDQKGDHTGEITRIVEFILALPPKK
jgi:cytochrome c551/c552